MASAAATAAIGSSLFSPSIRSSALRSPSSSSSAHLRLARLASPHHALRSSSEPLFRPAQRAQQAAVAQEEAALTAAAEETEAETPPSAAAAAEEEAESPAAAADDGDQGGGDLAAIEAANTKLYFGNLPYSVDSAQLAGVIQDHASPELIEVLYDRATGRSRGFAFVTMSSVEDCERVIQNLDGSQYMGRILRVNFSDKPKPKEPLYPESEHKLFVGNLSWSVTSESLTKAFREYGDVVGARVLFDGESGRSKGYGFVCYSTKAEMETALEALNGVELEGRAMRVSLAEGKRSYNEQM